VLVWLRYLIFCIVCAGCLPQIPLPPASRTVTTGEQLLDESFDTPRAWDTYNLQGALLGVTNGAYRIQAGISQYVFGLYHASYDNVVIEAEAYLKSDYRKGIFGVMCRASSAGKGYYFVISADGNFSIRRGAGNAVDPLVQWQATTALNTQTGRNLLRVVCVGDYLALYINGQFVADTTDRYYRRGSIGLTAALPIRAKANDVIEVVFDNVRVWAAQ
jgi:hypothetical protein